MVNRLHWLRCRAPLTPSPNGVDSEGIRESIFKSCALPVAFFIAQSIEMHCQFNNTHVSAIRTFAAYPLANNNFSWPVVEWIENNQERFMAIFHVDNPDDPTSCGWLVHAAPSRDTSESNILSKRSIISWNVPHLNDLKTLFGAAQHIQGISEWSTPDALKLYYEAHPEVCSDEECRPEFSFANIERIRRYSQLLHLHLSKIRQVEAAFNKVQVLLKHLCPKQGNSCVPISPDLSSGLQQRRQTASETSRFFGHFCELNGYRSFIQGFSIAGAMVFPYEYFVSCVAFWSRILYI